MENLRGALAPNSGIRISAKVKTFVLDTNVLLHDPQSIYKFEDNNLAIPVEVLEELDAIKGETCDDGNVTAGAGCSVICIIE